MNKLDNDKDLRQEILYEFLNQFKEDKYLSQGNTDKAVGAIDQYTTTKINEVLDAVEELCQEAEGVNLEHNGRPDCKNCSLLENLEDKLSQIKNTHKPNVESEESL